MTDIRISRSRRVAVQRRKRGLFSNRQLEFLEQRTAPAVFLVSSTGDEPAVDPSTSAETSLGTITLRSALQAANAQANDILGPDEIHFDITGSVVHTITPTSSLPVISEAVIIDGYTQPGSSSNTQIVGSNAVILIEVSGANSSLTLAGGGSTLRGIAQGGATYGIVIRSDNNVVEGNHLGIDATGAIARENSLIQVWVQSGSNNLIGGVTPQARNVITGGFNNGEGTLTVGNRFDALPAPSSTIIRGNYIGTNAAGTAGLGSGGGNGVVITEGLGTVIGGDDAADGAVDGVVRAGNLISAILSEAISLKAAQATEGDFDGVVIQGNVIGLDSSGNLALANGTGIGTGGSRIDEGLIQIGGTTAGAGNVISGNTGWGIQVNAVNVRIQGNRVGTNVAGDAAVGNAAGGVAVQIGGTGTPALDYLIGGAIPEARNIISGNGSNFGNGIEASGIDSGSLRIQGNWIGLAADGVTALPNTGNGVDIVNRQALIGGTQPGEGNVIAHNGRSGVLVTGAFVQSVTATILGNSIYANVGLGIDLGGNDPGVGAGVGNGVTPNDNLDPDTGPNGLQNYPIISSALFSGTGLTVEGTLNSLANSSYRIEFFANETADSSGHGEGQIYLGFVEVQTDAAGNASFSENFALPPVGFFSISTTATATNGDTSEFSSTVEALQEPASNDLSVTITDDPDPVSPSGTLTYTITVTTAAGDEATDVSLLVTIPTGVALVSFDGPVGWVTDATQPTAGDPVTATASIATATAGSQFVFTLVVLVNANATDGQLISGSAQVNSTSDDPNDQNNTAEISTTVSAPADPSANLVVTKTASAAPAVVGQDLTYTLTVTNQGPDDATNVILVDTLPSGVTFVSATGGVTPDQDGVLTFAIGDLANGESLQFQIIVTPTSTGSIVNTAAVTSAVQDPDTSNNTANVPSSVISFETDLLLTKVAGTQTAIVGQNLTYTLTLTNNGSQTATAAVVTDTLPTGVVFVSATGDVQPNDQGVLTFQAGDLAFGATMVFTIVVQPQQVGSLVNTADASFDGTDYNPADNSASSTVNVTTAANLAISITATPSPVGPAEQVTFTFTVTNNGPQAAENVELASLVPGFTTFVSFVAPNGWTIDAPLVGATGAITASIASLASGESAVFTLVVLVDSNTPDQTVLSASGTVSSDTFDPDNQNNEASASAIVEVPPVTVTDLSITMTVSPSSVNPSQNLTFTITVTNTGQISASDLNLTTNTPDFTTFQSFTAPQGWTNTVPTVGSTGSVSSVIASLGAGQSAVFTFVVRVNNDTAFQTTISGQSAVTTTTPVTDPNNNSAQASALVVETLTTNVNVTLTDNVDPAAVGQDVTYTTTVTNSGTGNATGVVISIAIPSNVTIVSLGGGTQTATGVDFNVGQMATGATQQFQVIVRAVSTGMQTLTASVTADAGVVVGAPASQSTTITNGTGNGAGIAPTVESVVRYGFHAQATLLVVTFSQAMDETTAANAANYTVILSPRDSTFGNSDDRAVSILRVYYNPDTFEATLLVSERIYAFRPFELVVKPAITDADGNALDGNGDGVGGDSSVTTLDLSSIVGRASEAPDVAQLASVTPAGVLALSAAKKSNAVPAKKVATAAVRKVATSKKAPATARVQQAAKQKATTPTILVAATSDIAPTTVKATVKRTVKIAKR